jgi:hypothetical protein
MVNTGYPLVDAKMAAISSASNSTDAIVNYINVISKQKPTKLELFYWTASNISYDVPGMFDLNVNETVPEKIAKR